jgi:excisionase family DNA binding protein
MEKLYSPKEVAFRLNVHVNSIRRWLKTGKIKGCRAGRLGHWKIPRSEVERFFEGSG